MKENYANEKLDLVNEPENKINSVEVTNSLAAKWKSMTREQKKKFNDEAREINKDNEMPKVVPKRSRKREAEPEHVRRVSIREEKGSETKCILCDKIYKDVVTLKIHMIGDHQANSIDENVVSNQGRLAKCSVCDKLIATLKSLELHIEKEHPIFHRQ